MSKITDEIKYTNLENRIIFLISATSHFYNTSHLKKEDEEKYRRELKTILAYFDEPMKIKEAAYHGGVLNLRQKYETELYKLHLQLNIEESVQSMANMKPLSLANQRKIIRRLQNRSEKFATKTSEEQKTFIEKTYKLSSKEKEEIINKLKKSAQSFAALPKETQKKNVALLKKLMQQYKMRKSFDDVLEGKKIITAGFPDQELDTFVTTDTAKDISIKKERNIIKRFSRSNIRNLIELLDTKKRAKKNASVLWDDEHEVFKLLCDMPYKLEHATNFYYPILNEGQLKSYTEIQRQDPNFVSSFSTKGNIKSLGNGGFVFFRLFTEGVNIEKSRFGKTRINCELSLLNNMGWISLHDQLKPFSRNNAKARTFKWKNIILRTAETMNINKTTKQKNMEDGIKYTYRTEQFDAASQTESQKSFKQNKANNSRTCLFTREIFYGKDIKIGIALSLLYELRQLEECGFRHYFLEEIKNESADEKIKLLGNLLKGLFRVEAKYPHCVPFSSNPDNDSLRVKVLGFETADKALIDLTVNNPDGDGRYNKDLSINEEAMKLAILKDEKKNLETKLSNARRARARAKKRKDKTKHEEYNVLVNDIVNKEKKIMAELEKFANAREQLMAQIKNDWRIPEEIMENITFANLYIIAEQLRELFDETFEKLEECTDDTVKPISAKEKKKIKEKNAKIEKKNKQIDKDNKQIAEKNIELFKTLSRISFDKLSIIATDFYMELLTEDYLTLEELVEHSAEKLDEMTDFNLSHALYSEDSCCSFKYLVELYDKDPIQLACICEDDIGDLIFEYAPKINNEIMSYAERKNAEFGPEINLEKILKEVAEALSSEERGVFEKNIRNWLISKKGFAEKATELMSATEENSDADSDGDADDYTYETSYYRWLFKPSTLGYGRNNKTQNSDNSSSDELSQDEDARPIATDEIPSNHSDAESPSDVDNEVNHSSDSDHDFEGDGNDDENDHNDDERDNHVFNDYPEHSARESDPEMLSDIEMKSKSEAEDESEPNAQSQTEDKADSESEQENNSKEPSTKNDSGKENRRTSVSLVQQFEHLKKRKKTLLEDVRFRSEIDGISTEESTQFKRRKKS